MIPRDDVLRMAREAGIRHEPSIFPQHDCTTEDLERFAALVASHEREACAKVADPKSSRGCDCERCDCGNSGNAERAAQWDAETAIAAAIRQRAGDLK